jgi:hypothetical protein
MRPQSLKEAIERILLAGEEERIAIAEFLDEFYLQYGRTEQLQTMIDAPPPVSGRQPLDAYVGAIGEHLARRWGLTIPVWVEDECRFLDTPIFADDLQLMKPILLRDSPIAFRRRLIFTEAEPLRRGRFPVESAGFTYKKLTGKAVLGETV